MDDKCSSMFIEVMTQNETKFQLISPHTHRRNPVEMAIQTYKNHLKAG